MYLKALDDVGHETVDSVLVHVDSTPPRITNIGLTKDGQKLLAFHNSQYLFDMTLVSFDMFIFNLCIYLG